MKSQVIKHSIMIAGHRTSVSLEDAFWQALKEIALSRSTPLSELIGSIDSARRNGNLSSAIRLFVLEHFQMRTGSGGNGGSGRDDSDPVVRAGRSQTPHGRMAFPAPMLPAQ